MIQNAFSSPIWRSLNHLKGHLAIPKRPQRIARHLFSHFTANQTPSMVNWMWIRGGLLALWDSTSIQHRFNEFFPTKTSWRLIRLCNYIGPDVSDGAWGISMSRFWGESGILDGFREIVMFFFEIWINVTIQHPFVLDLSINSTMMFVNEL